MNRVQVLVLAAAASVAMGLFAEAWGQAVKTGGMTAKQKEGERKALSAFAAGDYQDAVNLYSELFADSRDPIYLRNIGRCYQRLKNPERSISSFEEYLLKARQLTKEERQEIVGYINEMKALKAEQAAAAQEAAASAAPAAPPPSFPVAPASVADLPPPAPVEPAPVETRAQDLTTPGLSQPSARAADANARIRWVAKGALIFAGAMAVVSGALLWSSWSKYGDAENGKCLPDGCANAADSISARNLGSQITFGLAAASAAAGGALLILYPSTASRPGLSAGVAFTY